MEFRFERTSRAHPVRTNHSFTVVNVGLANNGLIITVRAQVLHKSYKG